MISKSEQIKILTSLRNNIKQNKYPLSYDDYSFYNCNPDFNCYAYAMGLKTPNKFFGLMWNGLNLYNPGTISGFKHILYDENSLVEAFLRDCDCLGLQVADVSIDSPLEDDVFKISLFIEHKKLLVRDFHFIRENSDGTWSHMQGMGGKVSILDDLTIPKYDCLKTYRLVGKNNK